MKRFIHVHVYENPQESAIKRFLWIDADQIESVEAKIDRERDGTFINHYTLIATKAGSFFTVAEEAAEVMRLVREAYEAGL